MPHPVVSPEERFRSGIGTLKAVLIVDVAFGLLNVTVLPGPDSLGKIGQGVCLLIALALLALLRAPAYCQWALAAWVAVDLVTLGIEATHSGSLSLWLIFTIVVAAYVWWACTAGERGMKNTPAGEPAPADDGV